MRGWSFLLAAVLGNVACLLTFAQPKSATAAPTPYSTIAAFVSDAEKRPIVRAQVRGAVTYAYTQRSLYIQDSTAGLFVSSATNPPLVVGDLVLVEGTGERTGFSPTLTETQLQKVGKKPPALPRITTAKEIMSGRHDMELVRVRGTILETLRRPDGTIMVRLISGSIPFTVELDEQEIPRAWSGL